MNGACPTSASSRSVEISNTSLLNVLIPRLISVNLRFGLRDLQEMNNKQLTELARLQRVLAVDENNGNQLFIQNIGWEIAAIQRGDCSPLIKEYLTPEEQASARP